MRHTAEELRGFAARIMEKAGLSPEACKIFSDSLVRADLRGISSHGVTRLAAYSKRVELGLVNGRAVPEVVADGGSLVSVNGKNGMGAYVGAWAMDLCIQRARERGNCFAAVSHCNHFGYAAYFTERAAEAGMLGLAIANGPKALPPTGGSIPLLGTNPLAVSLPTGVAGRPLTLDMATSAAARGKVTLARKTGHDIPLGWGVDRNGNSTTDPNAVLSGGAMLPVGGPKGYAISLIIECLCSCLTGSDNGQTMGSFYDMERVQNTGFCLAAMDLSKVIDSQVWNGRMAELLSSIRACPRQPGVDEIKIPGQPEQEAYEQHLAEGLELPEAVEQELRQLAGHYQVAFPLE
ncbi:MAG: Ldh family oxidoreductase [Lawsonibacter sp.]